MTEENEICDAIPTEMQTHGSERSCEPAASVTTKRGDWRVKIDACADSANSRTGNIGNNMTKSEESWIQYSFLKFPR